MTASIVSAAPTTLFPSTITTVIRMAAAAFDLSATDRRTGQAFRLDLAGSSRTGRESLVVTLCKLHGIGTPGQWASYRKALKRDHAAERTAHRERRIALKAEKAARKERVAGKSKSRLSAANAGGLAR